MFLGSMYGMPNIMSSIIYIEIMLKQFYLT
jgi:hypothetical protein